MNGIINVYKEKGYTSHDVAAIIKKLFKEKTGHAGTLDPEAEGVLIVLLGAATRLSDYLMADEKEYRAAVKFGAATTTYDHTGEITQTGEVNFTEEGLKNAVSSFIGEQEQVPPMYSAIKVGGKKLYDLARKGIETKREARKVVISDITVERFNGFDEAQIYVKCGKGVYIRSICHDLGTKLGCGAHMTALTRTCSGSFRIASAHKLEEIKAGGSGVIIPMEKALERYNRLTVSSRAAKLLYNGARIPCELLINSKKPEDLNTVYDEAGRLIGIYEAVSENGKHLLKPKTMIYRSGANGSEI